MSMQAINYAMTLPVDEPGPRLLLIVIAHHVNWKSGDMYVSQDELAEETRCSVRSIRTYLGVLQADGVITREETRKDGRRGPDRITLNGYLEWQKVIYEGGTIADPRNRKKLPETSAGSDFQPANSDEPTGKISPPTGNCLPVQREPLRTIDNLSAPERASDKGARAPAAKKPLTEHRITRADGCWDEWIAWLSDHDRRDLVVAAQAAGEMWVVGELWPHDKSRFPRLSNEAIAAIEAERMVGGE